MVSPVVREGHESVTAYFPDARWYDYYNGAEVNTSFMLNLVIENFERKQ